MKQISGLFVVVYKMNSSQSSYPILWTPYTYEWKILEWNDKPQNKQTDERPM